MTEGEPDQCTQGGVRRIGPNSFQWCTALGQLAMAQTETLRVPAEYEKASLF